MSSEGSASYLAVITVKNFPPQSVSWLPLVIHLSPHLANTNLFSISIVLPFLECHVNGILYTCPSGSAFSLSIRPWRFKQVVVCISDLLVSLTK